MTRIPPEVEVLAAIGAWALHQAQGRPELAQDIFDNVLPPFKDRYPHHKLLSHWCQDAREPINVTPGVESDEDGMTTAELIRRLKLFPPDARVVVQVHEHGFEDIAGVQERPDSKEVVILVRPDANVP